MSLGSALRKVLLEEEESEVFKRALERIGCKVKNFHYHRDIGDLPHIYVEAECEDVSKVIRALEELAWDTEKAHEWVRLGSLRLELEVGGARIIYRFPVPVHMVKVEKNGETLNIVGVTPDELGEQLEVVKRRLS